MIPAESQKQTTIIGTMLTAALKDMRPNVKLMFEALTLKDIREKFLSGQR